MEKLTRGVVSDGAAWAVCTAEGSPAVIIGGRDVIADAKDAVFVRIVGDSPIVGRSPAKRRIAQMVVTSHWWFMTINIATVWGRDEPASAVGDTFTLIIEPGDGTVASTDLVLRACPVVVTPRGVGGENGNVLPRSWVPIRIIVPLLRAFEAAPTAARILAGVDRGRTWALIGDEETFVALARFAVLVVTIGLVHAVVVGLLAIIVESVESHFVVRVGIVWNRG